MSYDNLSSVSQNVLKFYQQLTDEERRIPFIFDDFHFCRSRVIGLVFFVIVLGHRLQSETPVQLPVDEGKLICFLFLLSTGS